MIRTSFPSSSTETQLDQLIAEQEDRNLNAQREEFTRTLNHLTSRLSMEGANSLNNFTSIARQGDLAFSNKKEITGTHSLAHGTSITEGGGFSQIEKQIMQQLQVLPKVRIFYFDII